MFGPKFVKFLMSNFEMTSQILLQILHHSLLSWYNSTVNFKLINFLLWTKGSHQSPNFETFQWCGGENLSNSSCYFWKHKSVFLQILYHSSVPPNITPLYVLSSKFIYFGQKQPIKVYIFETFKCLSQNSLNSLCQFWNDKSIPQRHYT